MPTMYHSINLPNHWTHHWAIATSNALRSASLASSNFTSKPSVDTKSGWTPVQFRGFWSQPRVLVACSIWFASVPPVASSITRQRSPWKVKCVWYLILGSRGSLQSALLTSRGGMIGEMRKHQRKTLLRNNGQKQQHATGSKITRTRKCIRDLSPHSFGIQTPSRLGSASYLEQVYQLYTYAVYPSARYRCYTPWWYTFCYAGNKIWPTSSPPAYRNSMQLVRLAFVPPYRSWPW